jgi:hypothetical protein
VCCRRLSAAAYLGRMTDRPAAAVQEFTITVRRCDAVLLAVAVVLAAAFFLAPPLLSPGRFDDFPRAFAAYWTSGVQDFPPDLQHLVDRHFRRQLARVVIALALLAVLVVLAVRLRRFRLPIGALALAAAVLLVAGVQGAVSPFGTLLPALADGVDVAALQAQARDQFESGSVSPALGVMMDEYVRWHVVKAVLVGVLAAVLVALSVVVWRRRRWFGLFAAVPALAAVVVVVANVVTVVNPVPPFLLLFEGGW